MTVTDKILQQLISQRDALLKEVTEKTSELQKLTSAINTLQGAAIRNNWTESALQCIKGQNKLLSTIDILQCVVVNTDDLNDEKKRKNYTVALSIALANMCKDNIIKKVAVDGKKGFFYGLSAWFDANNKVLKEYEDELINKLAFISTVQRLNMESAIS